MLDDATVAGSPDWWLLRLGQQLSSGRKRFDKLDAYWRGDHPIPYGNKRMREAYKRLQKQSRSNYTNLIAETVLERMKVTGFRAGGEATDTQDGTAWGWWQANRMDANSLLVHRAAVVMSRAYVIVGDKGGGTPLVTGEDPRQVIHESDPVDRYTVRAAMKVWNDDVLNVAVAVLYLPDSIHYYVSRKPLNKTKSLWAPSTWDLDLSNSFAPAGVAGNDLGEVPVVPFVNRPDLAGNGLGEFEHVIDIQDRINTITLDLMVISAMQAYRQRWAKGIDPEDDKGNPQTLFDPGADLLWLTPEIKAEFGEFGQTDLSSLLKNLDSAIQSLCAICRTPPHYMIGQIVNASGDALAAAETGLTSLVTEREQEYGESWEAVYRLAGKVMGQTIPPDAEVIWRDPQFRTLTEMAAGNVQLEAAGVPWRTRMSMLDKTPQEIDRMAQERQEDAALNAPIPVMPPPLATSVKPPNNQIPTAKA